MIEIDLGGGRCVRVGRDVDTPATCRLFPRISTVTSRSPLDLHIKHWWRGWGGRGCRSEGSCARPGLGSRNETSVGRTKLPNIGWFTRQRHDPQSTPMLPNFAAAPNTAGYNRGTSDRGFFRLGECENTAADFIQGPPYAAARLTISVGKLVILCYPTRSSNGIPTRDLEHDTLSSVHAMFDPDILFLRSSHGRGAELWH